MATDPRGAPRSDAPAPAPPPVGPHPGGVVAIVAIIAVAGLLYYALQQKVDGTLLAAGIAIIAGLGGLALPIKMPWEK